VLPSWTDLDRRAIDTARVLAMDAVQRTGDGHPGTAMAMAPAAYLLFQEHLRHNPADPGWVGRDRFVLSMGHSSLTLYTQLFLSGYGLELTDLQQLRTWGSATPGHPEHGHTPGVETTTGPLGQGVGNAVGMMLAQRRVRGLLDPDAGRDESAFDWSVYCLASDGDLEEGVSAEASSLAATQRLDRLTVIWDDNHISIDDNTCVAFTEDVMARYAAYGWHVQSVDALPAGNVDVVGLDAALRIARLEVERPSFIRLRSHIGWPAPNARDSSAAHGSALGAEEVAATKVLLGFDPERSFDVDPEVLAHARQRVAARAAGLVERWQELRTTWESTHPERAALDKRLTARQLPDGWDADLPCYPDGSDPQATRVASGAAINALASHLPELWGGSADLTGSNNTMIRDAASALPADRQSAMFPGDPFGRNLHFGVREHGMGAIANGIVLEGHTRPYVATFLVFSDYMRGSVRLAALMGLPVVYVWTHDSIGLGGDGPTHQPIEHLMALRAMPNLTVVRPADGNETSAAWRFALTHQSGPTALVLSRQKLPTIPGTADLASAGVARGGYVVADAEGGDPEVILIGTGSEVSVAWQARKQLQAEGVPTRLVSLPSWEVFSAQAQTYRDDVLPPSVRARVSIEAGATLGWREWVGDHGVSVGIDRFGASADDVTLFEEFGFTPERVVTAAHQSLTRLHAEGSGQ